MSNVSIFEKKWLDLVFEGKNQKYGAYQLRLESSKTTLFAFLFGMSILVGGTFLLSSFSAKPIITKDPFTDVIIKFDSYHPPVEEVKPKTEIPKVKTPAVKASVDNKNYHVAPKEQAVVPVSKTIDNPTTTSTSTIGGTGTSSVEINTGSGAVVMPKAPDNGTHVASELDRLPLFPGGLKGFYEYVGNHFEKQEIEEGETIRVLVSFVIEKNGTMTDIDVVQKNNPAVDREAIRVLKSLKTKWTPGFKNGEPMRTQYTLPISVKSE